MIITMASAVWAQAVKLAVVGTSLDPVPEPDDVKPGWIALAIFLLMVGVTVLLWRNMRKQLGKIQSTPEPRIDQADRPTPGAGLDPDR